MISRCCLSFDQFPEVSALEIRGRDLSVKSQLVGVYGSKRLSLCLRGLGVGAPIQEFPGEMIVKAETMKAEEVARLETGR